MSESRKEAFKSALKGVHVTAAVNPGFYDKTDDIIGALKSHQTQFRNIAVNMFSKSGVSPDQIKGINKVVLHDKDALAPGTKAAYVKEDSSLHVNLNGKNVAQSVAHEVGHHVNEHPMLDAIENLHGKGNHSAILRRVGAGEAEADHFASPNDVSKNTYVHAVTQHLTGMCTKTHGSYSHKMLSYLGQGYSDRMKTINPGIHKQLTGENSDGN